ncbi:MAG: adenylyltransferase, partial [Verrucomicrobia bacterium]
MNIDNAHSHGHLIAPHGGELVDLKLAPENAAELKACSKDFPSWDLTSRQIRDLELLLSGGFSPLRGFMRRDEYELVRDAMRLSDGLVWPIPITLDVP